MQLNFKSLLGKNLVNYDSAILTILAGVMVLVLCFFLAWGASHLACWASWLQPRCHWFLLVLGIGLCPCCWIYTLSWPLVLIPTAQPFRGFQSQSCLTSSKIERKPDCCIHIIWSAGALWQSSQVHLPSHPFQPLPFQAQCGMKDFSTQLLSYTPNSQAIILLGSLSSNLSGIDPRTELIEKESETLSQIFISISRDVSFPPVIPPNRYLAQRDGARGLFLRHSLYLDSNKSPLILPSSPLADI